MKWCVFTRSSKHKKGFCMVRFSESTLTLSPNVCCLCVFVCTYTYTHFFKRVKALYYSRVKPSCFSHADQPHKLLPGGFHMDLLNFSTSKQNPLVQSQCVTGHQLLSVHALAASAVDSADCLRSLFTINKSCYATFFTGLGLIFSKLSLIL